MPKFRFANLWALACLLISLNSSIFAQGARVNPSGAGEDADRDNPAARDRWFMQGRVAPKGKTPAELRWKAYQQKIGMRAARMAAAHSAANLKGAAAPAASGSGGWTALGPAPLVSNPGTGQDYGFVSGRATSVVIDHADPTGNTAYLGGAFGGLWRTRNGLSGGFGNPSGVTWTPLIDAMGTLAVGAIGLQPCNGSNCDNVNHLSNVILLGTGEANSSADSYYGLGILRSPDAGVTWNLIAQDTLGHPFHGLAFSKFAFSAANPSVVVAATATSTTGLLDGARTGTELRGVYVSNDSGQSWTFENSVKDGTTSINQQNSVTSVVYNATDGLFYAIFRYHGVYTSADGANWTRLVNQPNPTQLSLANCPTATGGTACVYRGEIAVVPTRNEMYVWFVYDTSTLSDQDGGIWKSTDSGATWTQITDTGISNCGTQDNDGGCGTAQGGYDLELAAMANGANTDLYAGARNLFKCTITASSPSCNGTTEPNFFMNLSHVYGCSNIAKVHPDQHALDSLVASGNDVMYFANDGGVYRAVNAFTGLHTGVCGSTNQFDSLNGSLGSMGEFVSLSQDPIDPNTILGGTQDNGSPASSAAQSNSQWHSVLGGDGGYNEINPNTTGTSGQWFTSNPPFLVNNVRFNLNIYSCSSGSSCLDGNFGNTTQNATVGGDFAPFYPFFELDPQAPAKMLIGTDCRLWRGDVSSGTASGFVALTDSFESPGAVPCSGQEVNQVHAADAGGPTDANGSKVVYAVTEGTGPNLAGPGGAPTGGEAWASKNASGGAGTWANVTATINPNHYSIGAVTVDLSDPTGLTAYVGIQGFHTSHVFKTTNGGANWTDFTGTATTAIPDAPVNTLIVDAAAAVLYAGTDTGVFSSSTTTPSWAEVGPAPSSGTAGYLPDAPVTKMRLFNGGGAKILRASTYGRGIWQFVLVSGQPSFSVTTSPTTVVAYPAQTVTFSGTLTSINGYTGTVTISCGSGAPAACTPPAPIALAANTSVNFAVTASSALPGTSNFNIHGTDGTLVSDQPVTLNLVNFVITPPIPVTVSANVPNFSNPTSFQITAQGPFADTVTLSCSGLPSGAACNFSPSPMVQPTATSPIPISLAISTTPSTPVTSSTVTITAHDAANPEPSPKTQTITLTTTANPDYALAISNTPQTTTVLGSATFNGTLSGVNGYAGGTIALSCGAGAPSTCTPPAPILMAAGGSANFTVAASNATVASFNFNIHATDGSSQHDVPVALTVNADFHVPATVVTCTPVTAGGVSTCSIPIGPDGQSTFANNVTYVCATAGFPNLSSCTFNPVSIPAGSSATTVVLSIRTTQAVAGLRPTSPFRPTGPLFAFWLSLPALGIVSLGMQRRPRRTLPWLVGMALALALAGFLTACGGGSSGGGGGQPGTTKGTYTFNVDATSNGITHSAPMTLTVN